MHELVMWQCQLGLPLRINHQNFACCSQTIVQSMSIYYSYSLHVRFARLIMRNLMLILLRRRYAADKVLAHRNVLLSFFQIYLLTQKYM